MITDVVHGVGVAAPLVIGALAVVVAGVECWRDRSAVRRLGRALGARSEGGGHERGTTRWLPHGTVRVGPAQGGGVRRRAGPAWTLAVVSALGVAWLFGGLLGALAGLGAGMATHTWARKRRQAAHAARDAAGGGAPRPGELPLCADLMAACLATGATPGEAAGAVGRCLDGPLGTALIRVQAELRLGAEPQECWARFGRAPGAREMGRCLARAYTTGTAPVAEMSRLAAEYRAAQNRSALARSRKAAVLATAPLGVCFLPAFLLVGVVPVVVGLAGAVLGGRLH